ncbi:MAG: HDOD domain-containing protein [Desulfovibrionaceae bacterium]
MMRVLFVDDDPRLLASLRRLLYAHEDIEAGFAGDGPEALAMLDRQEQDILVADMRMPGMDGVQLLEQVRDRHPRTVRIVLSGHSDQEMVMRSVKLAHQYLSKPCSFEELTSTLTRVYTLREVFTDATVAAAVTSIETLPVLPRVYEELMEELRRDGCSLEAMGRIVSRDVTLTAGLLKVVNSSFFGLRRTITSPEQAVTYLGTDILRGLILYNNLFSTFDQNRHPGFSFDRLWTHSLTTARFAKAICELEHKPIPPDEAFNAGLLHDVGKLVLADKLAIRYADALELVRSEHITVWAAEKAVLGVSHAELGGYLLGLWGFSESLVKAVWGHHEISRYSKPPQPLLGILHAANVLEHELVVLNPDYVKPELDAENALAHGVTPEKFAAWRDACAEVLKEIEAQ